MGILDLNKTVYSLCEEYPQLVGILQGLGFESIGNPIMMKTAARVMTIPKAAQMKGLPMVTIITALQEAGFVVEGGE
ncbi:DUF1858 domain-containing protein [Acidaminobacter sp.]|uniref:DUF1858 domain-containing protein n=1 Tax=Acidaminobacter sp. TaxID=1872102 RepID=UPI001380AF4C|nr:DUF1858 domain-containing protein [Acidaminobacter sp.]MDK9710170.1 DUF1858 domain-containing protein [Acidaminobacter sp.]MZQ98744.1 DUF1858 domain-containing protein [Acidaminobacter sp.]